MIDTLLANLERFDSAAARAAHNLPVKKLKRVFASILYVLAAYMLWKGLAG